MFVVSAGALLATSFAWADDAGDSGPIDAGPPLTNCDPLTLLCSNAEMGQLLESKEELPIGIDTGWMPKCPAPTPPDQHCSDQKIQVRAWMRFTPAETGGAVYSIDMPGKVTKVDARWPDVDGITLSLAKGPVGTSTFKVSHGLVSSFAIYIDTPVFTGEISINESQILPLIPGGQAFNYKAMNTTKFASWGFDKVSLNVGNAVGSELFAITFHDLGKIVNVNNMDDYIEGSFSFNARTQSTFTYQTNSVIMQCMDPGCTPIPSQNSTTKSLGNFENAMDFMANAKGTLRYSGEIEFLPVINITSVAGFGITLKFPISVGMKIPYDSNSIPLTFPNANVHIPLPNIYMDTTPMKFSSDITVGQKQTLTRPVENTGEMEAVIYKVESTSSAFKSGIASQQLDANSGSLDLPIIFAPPKPGKYTAKIIVTTNDPDTPKWTWDVTGGNGDEVPPDQDAGVEEDGGYVPKPGGPGFYGSNADSGCGCRTSPTPSGIAVTSLALLGLGLALLRRNRRD
jgi:MYXO-CTERM domain-containing protein